MIRTRILPLAIGLALALLAACSQPLGLDPALAAPADSRAAANLSGPNGSIAVSGMDNTSLTVSYSPSAAVGSARLYVTEGNGRGLVLASQGMNYQNGAWTHTFSHPTFKAGAKIGILVLTNLNGVETCVPQGILADSGTWATVTYGTVEPGFTVNFDSQGAATPASPASMRVVSPATTVGSLPSAPVKPGYTFLGWFTAATGGSAFTAATPVSADLTVYAQWKPVGGQLILSGPNGSVQITEMANASFKVIYAPATPVDAVRLFVTQGNGTGLVIASQPMTLANGVWTWTCSHPSFVADAKIGIDLLQVRAGVESNVPQGILSDSTTWASFKYGFIPYAYTVSFDGNGADTPATPGSLTVSAPATTVGTLPAAPTRADYVFAGWNTLADGSGSAFAADTPVSADLTVYARWVKAVPCTVTFDSLDATTPATPATKTVMAGSALGTLPSTPVKLASDGSALPFSGWFTAATAGERVTEATIITADLRVYARFDSIIPDQLMPLASGMHMTMQFRNLTKGAWRDDQIYATMLARNKAGDWCWVQPNGTLKPMSVGDNGQLSKNGRLCANYSIKLSDMQGFQLPPYIDSGRVFVTMGSPLYITVNIDGNGRVAYAAPDLNNATDPNSDVYFDWYEFAIVPATWVAGSPVGFWGNTTQVDQLSIPLMARVYEKNGSAGGTLIGQNGIAESRASLWAAWDREVPSQFRALKGEYRINAPCKDKNGFGVNSPNASYYNAYVDQVWNQYRTQTLKFDMHWQGANHTFTGRVQGDAFVFQMDGQGSYVAVARKPTTTEIFECSGVLATGNTLEGAIQARIAAAFNRHVMENAALWWTPAAFYQAPATNYYSKFMHDHAYKAGAYGFAYDDVGDFSGALWSMNGRAVVIDVNW